MLRRFILLLACVGTGAVIGVLGKLATDNAWWYLAVPAAVAAGWLWVGTPEKCAGPDRARTRRHHSDKEES